MEQVGAPAVLSSPSDTSLLFISMFMSLCNAFDRLLSLPTGDALAGWRAGWLLCSHFCFCFDWIMNIDMARVSGSFCLLRKHSDCSVGSPRWSGHSALRTPHSARRQRQEDINWILRSIFETCNSEPVTKQNSSPSPPPLTTAWSQITFLRVQRQISEFY